MTREGYIERIIYTNDENGYSVFSVQNKDGEEIFVGNAYGIGEGLYIVAEGEYIDHPQYNLQFKFTFCELSMPAEEVSIEKYLGSGIVKGIGEILAKRIVSKFKKDTLRIIEEEPERLAEVKGITEKKARTIAVSYIEKKEYRDAVIFLSQYGVSTNMAIKIFAEYGSKIYTIVRENPYKLAEDITGIGFKAADEIARNMGIKPDSEFRIRSAIIYVLNLANIDGHMYLPMNVLMARVSEIIYAQLEMTEVIENQIMGLAIDNKIMIKEAGKEKQVYIISNYYIEINTARMLYELDKSCDIDEKEIEDYIQEIEEKENIELESIQRQAVKAAATSGVAIITGGPGTGKTTIINVLLKYFGMRGKEIRLCAPTGRAAKRMTESTGWPAQTIHRLLEFGGAISQDTQNSSIQFGRNREYPLECDVVIVDEMSMVDNYLMNSLLQAIAPGTRLIMLGDIYQLPSVGAGNVLKDIINSECFSVTKLNKIFRQGEDSDIIYNAHLINKGEHIKLTNKSKDFFFIPKRSAVEIIKEVGDLVSNNLPKYLNISSNDIQVLTPMRKYEVGVEKMNEKLQNILNPAAKDKAEKEHGDLVFREGDKVMQIKNNYKKEWIVYGGKGNSFIVDQGIGVFNGDMGIVKTVSDFDESITVHFDDGRDVEYTYGELSELEHAFAITIHKSQGSEYPAVVIPLLGGNRKLLNRNLLYTAITRAKSMVVIVGNAGLVNQMIDNAEEQRRYTTLMERIKEIFDEQNGIL